ncbi:MAG: endonuclease [Eubacterium sp.]|nr:endonuclease [Eubacterium sp.]
MSKNSDKKKGGAVKKFFKVIGIILGVIIIAFLGFLGWLTAVEYKPEAVEKVSVDDTHGSAKNLTEGDEFSIMTWNIGYGCLGDNADFFMDGGTNVITATPERRDVNIAGMKGTIMAANPDILFFQEIDRDADRSYNKDELVELSDGLSEMLDNQSDSEIPEMQEMQNILGDDVKVEIENVSESAKDNGAGNGYSTSFAYNFKVNYVPYPIPDTIGKVNAGISIFSKYSVSDAERISLPCPFSWPIRTINLKRCLLVNRIPVKNAEGAETGKELVLVNLHLEAYDNGEGKAAQTEQLRAFLQEEYDKGNYVIAGGDFNQKFSSIDTSMYPEYDGMWKCGEIDTSVFGEHFQFEMDNSKPTCRSLDRPISGADRNGFQYYMIDGFIVSDNIEVSALQTVETLFAPSDHNPVMMQLKLK